MAVVEHEPRLGSPPWTAVLHDWVTTVDHKKIGILYILMSLVFLVIAGCEALLMRWQLFYPRNNFLAPDTFNQLFTMHGTTMVFFVGMPILIGMGNYLVPLMIGARDMAFPRLNAFGFWSTLFGGLLVYFSFATGGAPAMGWFAYAPLTERTFARGPATDFWALGLIVSGIGTLTGGINFVATILAMRAPGMSLRKVPFFVWTMLWTSVQIVLVMPPLTASLIMILLDRNLGAHFFDTQNGGSAYLWQHLFWFFGHPEVYILILPVFGMISEVIPVFSRKVLFGYEFMAAATMAIAFISLGVWAHHMFTVGMSRTLDLYFAAASLLDIDSHGDQVLQLAGDDVRRPDPVRLADAVCLRLPLDVLDRRPDGHHAGGRAVRFPALRQLFRGRPLSLGPDRRHAVRRLRRPPLLVSQGDRPDALRAAGALAVLAACTLVSS